MHISLIDFNDTLASQQFTDSLKHTGFAVLANHPVNRSLIDDVYEEWQTFFNSDAKHNYRFDPTTQDGYIPLDVAETAKGNDIIDLKEFFHLFRWGKYPKEISNKTMLLFDQLEALATTLLKWIQETLPEAVKQHLSMPLSDMIIDSPQTLLRILHYPALTGHEPAGAVRAAEHEDINLLTLLVGATESGLQAKDKHGQWNDVFGLKDHIIINAGDSLQKCTRGYFKSTTHRVINPSGEAAKKSRLSLPLFLHARPEVALDEQYTQKEYLDERLRELGLLK